MLRTTSAIFVLFALGVALVAQDRSSPISTPISVCDALHNLARYRSQVVEIRGEYVGAELIAGKNCRPLRSGNDEWPTRIMVERADRLADVVNERADFAFDLEAWENAIQALVALNRQYRENAVVYATVVGRLDTRDTLSTSPHRNGYGHLGGYPARLVVKTIRDVSITP